MSAADSREPRCLFRETRSESGPQSSLRLPVSRRYENCIVTGQRAHDFRPPASVQKYSDPLSCPDGRFDDRQVRPGGLDIPDKTGQLLAVHPRSRIVVRLRAIALTKLADPQMLEIAADAGLGRVYALVLQQAHQFGLALDRLALQDRQDGLLAPLAGF